MSSSREIKRNSMLTKNSFFLMLFFLNTLLSFHSKNGISYELSKGRLGDQMVIYAHTLFLSMKYDLNFLYKPFKLSDRFQLHYKNNLFFESEKTNYNQQIPLTESVILENNSKLPLLYLYGMGCTVTNHKNHLDGIQTIALECHPFKKKIQAHFTPIGTMCKIEFPTNCITVALHVRVGSGWDKPRMSKEFYNTLEYFELPKRIIDKTNFRALSSDEKWPAKFPPYQFYIDQLDLLAKLFEDQQLFVYIFTDHKNPQQLAHTFSKIFHESHPERKIIFQSHDDTSNVGVIDDFNAIASTDVLIRAASNFSRAAQLYGNHKLVIYLKKASWHDDALVSDIVGITAYNKDNHAYAELRLTTENMKNNFVIKNIKNTIKEILLPLKKTTPLALIHYQKRNESNVNR